MGHSTEVQQIPRNYEVMDSNLAGYWAFNLSLNPGAGFSLLTNDCLCVQHKIGKQNLLSLEIQELHFWPLTCLEAATRNEEEEKKSCIWWDWNPWPLDH